MKINGKTLNSAVIETIVIPRSDGDLVFRCQPVTDYTEFDAICPEPQPPRIKPRNGAEYADVKDKDYKIQMAAWGDRKSHYLFLKSLQATEGLEWSTVDMQNPDTWAGFTNDFKSAGLSETQISMILSTCIQACGLDTKKIEEATKRFLAGQEEALKERSSPTSEQPSTQSGEPANA